MGAAFFNRRICLSQARKPYRGDEVTMTQGISKPRSERGRIIRLWQNIRNHPVVYFMLIAVMTYFVLFCYWPMYGNIVAF